MIANVQDGYAAYVAALAAFRHKARSLEAQYHGAPYMAWGTTDYDWVVKGSAKLDGMCEVLQLSEEESARATKEADALSAQDGK